MRKQRAVPVHNDLYQPRNISLGGIPSGRSHAIPSSAAHSLSAQDWTLDLSVQQNDGLVLNRKIILVRVYRMGTEKWHSPSGETLPSVVLSYE